MPQIKVSKDWNVVIQFVWRTETAISKQLPSLWTLQGSATERLISRIARLAAQVGDATMVVSNHEQLDYIPATITVLVEVNGKKLTGTIQVVWSTLVMPYLSTS